MKKTDFENKICGVCNKAKLHGFQEQISPGFYVDAYKCSNGHISYTEEVMQKIEALNKAVALERHAIKIGSSIAIPIPAQIARAMNIKAKEKVYVTTKDNTIIIRPSST
ncbi:MAG: AbrB/MazE/SpoVT family DNA-binding domain-containing protein [Candidatus Micrarchaeia archaeon]|jgi:AbrB family looped-hinge helix DNA binding protein